VEGVLPVIVVLALSVFAVARIAAGLTRLERQMVWAGWALHVVCSFALIAIMRGFYGYGDVLTYGMFGDLLADLMWADFPKYAPEVLKLLLHLDTQFPFTVSGEGSTTGSMGAIAAIWGFFLAGSVQAMCMAMSMVALLTKVAMYRSLRTTFEERLRPGIFAAFVLIPTAAFWSAGIVKESVAISSLCVLVCAMQHFNAGRLISAAILGSFAATALGLVKPYILFTFVLSLGAWFYARRAIAQSGTVSVRPVYALLATTVAVGGVYALGLIFPSFGVENLSEGLAQQQELGGQAGGGSYSELIQPGARSLGGQLAYAPIALLSALFRPTVFEVRNGLMAINAVETTAALWLFVRPIWKRGPRVVWRAILSDAFLVFCATFVVSFGIAVGLVTSNLGTLSRYRMPLMPFFAVFVLIADAHTRRSRPRGANALPAAAT